MKQFIYRHARIFGVMLFLAFLLIIFQVSGLRAHLNLAFIREQLSAHAYLGFFLFVLLFCLGNLTQIPGLVFLAGAVLTLGQVMGGIVTFIAAFVSCIVTFLLIRFLGGDALRKINNPVLLKIFKRLDTHPVLSVVLARILFQTAPALNYALAMSGIKLRPYAMGTLLGLPLPVALYCVFFNVVISALHST
jgi:uncharacterized membrane protein YdjX (TVP38/TMEM64 family)